MFPPNFCVNEYKNNYTDLIKFSDDQLIKHYNNHGKTEGRICSKIYNRDMLKTYIDTNYLDCLEIGPFDSPVLTGEKVKYFDVLNKDELINRAININSINNLNNIPYIHFVNNCGNLNIINEKFDLVLSCHSIEHQVDFIQHLQDISNLLLPNGYYVIILPDKRYCFDHFIKETTIADVIDHHINKNKLHSIKSVIEHRALTCHNDCFRHWNNDHGEFIINSEVIKNSINEYNCSIHNNEYLDVHSLQFTPNSIENILNLLYNLSYIDLKICEIYSTTKYNLEFYVILKK